MSRSSSVGRVGRLAMVGGIVGVGTRVGVTSKF
jgi:hypothetical protein